MVGTDTGDAARERVVLFFDPATVTLTTVYEDAEKVLGHDVSALSQVADVRTKRASHVEPTEDGQWTADMEPMKGPVLGPFPLRRDALRAEHQWLEANL